MDLETTGVPGTGKSEWLANLAAARTWSAVLGPVLGRQLGPMEGKVLRDAYDTQPRPLVLADLVEALRAP